MNPLTESLLEADDAARAALEAVEALRDALQRCYDAAGARGLPLSLDLGPLATRVERMGPDLARVLKVLRPYAAAVRAEEACEV